MTLSEQVRNDEVMDASWRGIYKVGGTAALIVVILFITAGIFLIAGNQAALPLQNNFLLLIFKLHAGVTGVQEKSLEGLHLLDLSILALVSTMFLALYPTLKQVSKIWATIAVALPFVGLGLYIVTQDIGRSGILAAGLAVSLMMLKSESFSKWMAYPGILANGCLLIGDIGIAYGYEKILAVLMGIGYGFVTFWYGLISWRLYQLSQDREKEG